MAQNTSDNFQLSAPKQLDNRTGVVIGSTWRPFNDVAEFNASWPLIVRFPTQSFWVLNPTDSNKADLYALRNDKTPYKVLSDVDLDDYYTKSETRILLQAALNNDTTNLTYEIPTKGMVTFVIDSVANGIITEVLPAFTSRNLKASVALTVSDLRRLAKGDAGESYSWDGVKSVTDAGWEVGVRSDNGAVLNSAMTIAEGNAQMQSAKRIIQAFGQQTNFFVAPSTDYDPKFDPIMQKYFAFGFTLGASTGLNITNKVTTNPYRLNRVSLEGSTTLAQAKSFVDQAVSEKSQIVFYFHNTSPSTVYPTAKPISFFNDLLDYILLQDIDVVMPSEAISRMIPVLISKTAVRQNIETAIGNPYLTGGKNYLTNPACHANALGWTLDKTAVTSGSNGTVSYSPFFNDSRLTFTGGVTISLATNVGINERVYWTQDVPLPTAISIKQPVTFSAFISKLSSPNNLPNNITFARLEFYNVGGILISAIEGEPLYDTKAAFISRVYVTTTIPDACTNIRVKIGIYKTVLSDQIGSMITQPKFEFSLFPTAYQDNETALNTGPFVKFNLGGDADGDMYYLKDYGSVGMRLDRIPKGSPYSLLKISALGAFEWVEMQIVGTETNLPVYLKSNAVTVATMIASGLFFVDGKKLNCAVQANGSISFDASGIKWVRDVADANPVAYFKNINAGSTGDIIQAILSTGQITRINYLGKLVFATAAASGAWINIPAGTASANTGGIKWSAGSVLASVVETGLEEVDINGRYFTHFGSSLRTKYAMYLGVNSSTATTISKSDLNTAYQNAKTGMYVDYPYLTGGGISARKIDDSITGNWVLTPISLAV